jgi:integrase
MNELPGTLWVNRDRWNWKVRLPGSPSRRNYPLRLPGQSVAIPAKKDRSLAESVAWRMWEKASRHDNAHDSAGQSLDSVCGLFLAWGETYYRRSDGTPTRELANCEIALRSLRAAHGRKPINDVTYQDILNAREALVESGLNRKTINQRAGIWKRFFAWALENRYGSAQTKSEVWAITSLKRNRTTAPEGEAVKPVPHYAVKRTIPFLPPVLRVMVSVQELTGARPSELCAMRAQDIDRRGEVWVYRPATHKTEHKDRPRLICIGPRAQRLLRPLLDSDGPLFSPADAVDQRKAAKRSRRKSKVQPSQESRRKSSPKKVAGKAYNSAAYGKAIAFAIAAAHRACVEVEEWSPNQLRHACGTRVRRKYGPDAARAVLGHAGAGGSRITDIYTREAIEREMIKEASRPMKAIG